MDRSPVEHLREEKARRVSTTAGGSSSDLLDCKAGAAFHRSPAAATLVSSPITPHHISDQTDAPFMDCKSSVVSSPLVSADSTPVLVLSPPNSQLILSPASQAPANTPTCAKAATR